jgi:pimeloyl-ACP methyl ester carboxylesterase
MRTARRVMLSAVTAFAVMSICSATASAAADPAATCMAGKLKAAGKLAQKQLTCHAKATKKGEEVDASCLSKAAGAFAKSFTKVEGKGGCLDTRSDDAVQVEGLVDKLTTRTVTALLPAGASASTCSSKKLKSAGKRAAKILKAHGKTVKKADAGKLPQSMEKIGEKFAQGFTKAESQGDCQTTGDADAAAATVDAALDGILAAVKVIAFETLNIPSTAQPAETPGSSGVDASGYPNLVTQFGTTDVDLNNATYTRFYYQPDGVQPDAILILIPGFEAGATFFKMMAENLIGRALEGGTRVEIWAFDRRGHQLEDLVGQDIAAAALDPQIALDWYFGGELGLVLHPDLVAGPNRRAVFHDTHADTAFMANWTELVFSRDIDAVVEAARSVASNENVFLGGHSAGTGFTARYASTDFDEGAGVDAGYSKLRGLVLLDGGGGSSSGTPLSADALDRIEDKADGGLFFAVRDDAPRCVDGTPCTVATEATDCAAKGNATCTEPTNAYAVVPGVLNPRIIATGDISSIQAALDPNTGQSLASVDQGAPGNNAVAVVPDLAILGGLGVGTAYGGLGAFLDDDGLVASLSTFLATSLGAPGPVVDGLQTWQDITQQPLPAGVLPDNGPAPTDLSCPGQPGCRWGQEVEVTRIDRIIWAFFDGESNFADWYYPTAGPSTTSGLPSMDTTQISVDRNRPDIDNMTQAANINIPVICAGGSNGSVPVPGEWVPFAQSLGTCTAPSCDGTTPRVVDASTPNEAFPTLGEVPGGFEAHIFEGAAHLDINGGEDDASNVVIGPLIEFIERNMQ